MRIPASIEKIFKTFRAPKYLDLPAVAFDLSDRTVKYFSAKDLPGVGLMPDKHEERALPDGIISGGDIQDVGALAAELRYFKDKYKSGPFVNINLPEELAFVFDMEIRKSDLQNGNIRQYIEFKLSEYIPFDASQAIFDFDILRDIESKLLLSVTVYPQEVVEEYISAFELAGYMVKSAELETVSMYRAVVPKAWQNPDKSVLVLDIGTSKVGVSILLAGAPVFSTAISFPMKKFFENLFEKMNERKIKDDEELFAWKFKEGILFANESDLKDLHQKVLSEVAKIIDYFHGHKHKSYQDISAVILSGGNAATRGLDAFFESELGIDCQIADVWQNLFDTDKYTPTINRRKSLQYATLSGLTLKDKI